MPFYDVTIEATVTKTIRVEDAADEQEAESTAHVLFDSSEHPDEPERYSETVIRTKRVADPNSDEFECTCCLKVFDIENSIQRNNELFCENCCDYDCP